MAALACAALLFAACGKGPTEIPNTPDGTIDTVAQEIGKGNAEVVWDALPAKYQDDVTTVTHDLGSKVDSELYDKGFGLVTKAGDVIAQKKSFIANNEMIKQQAGENAETVIDTIVSSLNILSDSQLSTVDGLANLDVREFLATTYSEILVKADSAAVAAGEESFLQKLLNVKAELVETKDGSATLNVTAPDGETEEMVMKLIEGKWIPADLADDWDEEMTKIKKQIAEITPDSINKYKPQILGAIAMIEGSLSQLEAAKTQEEFDTALQNAMMPLMMMMMGGGSSAPGNNMGAPLPSMPGIPNQP